MAHFINAPNTSEAWLSAMEHLDERGGDEVNLAVAIGSPTSEVPAIRSSLDEFVRTRRADAMAVQTVANTIFPASLYRPHLGDRARAHLYSMHEQGYALTKRKSQNNKGTYFNRMVAWTGEGDSLNQLEAVVVKLQRNRERGHQRGNAYELGIAEPCLDVRIQDPDLDVHKAMGFPCLSHISLSVDDDRLHMSALYRNHDFSRRAYGNYLGLGRLQAFLARESGYSMGELMCISSHAGLVIGSATGFGRRALVELIRDCQAHVDGGT